MAVIVRVPHGMAWCVGNQKTVEASGATVRELWQNLHTSYPELMWRLSKEQGSPSFWVRITVDGRPLDQLEGLDTRLGPDSVVALQVLEGAAPGGSL